ncbi:adenylyl-sulfate kinase [Arthrobacter castelli]|uniref:adenylyl-sulfate kinase n=1 Tax=Arthrobacter castelli TaxID=271431 RepID=UPI000422DC4D|nr:adenylyl-sulfate kinase [Arthrobacter castelli]
MTDWQDVLQEPGHSFDYDVLDTLELLLGGLLADGSASYVLPRQAGGPNPAAPLLQVPAGPAEQGIAHGSLQLRDPDGTPLARLDIADSEPAADGTIHLSGQVSALQPPEHGLGRDIRITSPLEAPEGRPHIAAIFDAPPAAADIAKATATVTRLDGHLHLIAISDGADGGNRELAALIDVLRACAAELDNASAHVLVVPGHDDAAHGTAGTCGAHVVGRLGAGQVLDFAGHEPAENAAEPHTGLVVLFTGLSGSGKSTLARELVQQVHRVDPRKALLLDGDDIRRFLTAGLGFTREDRNTNVERIGWVGAQISAVGGIAVCAPIAPFEESRRRVAELARAAGQYLLVHVSTPLEVCEQRDRKGLYAKARAGEIPDFTGIDSPYDVPVDPDFVVDTSVTSVEDATADILHLITHTAAAPTG